MEVSAVNNSLDIQSILLSDTNKVNRQSNGNDTADKTAEYAKKGEPMYMAEMDEDNDGVVTLDEFRAYCKNKGIGANKMIKMSQLASAYRTMKAESEAIDYISKLTPNVHPNVKNTDNKYTINEGTNQNRIVNYNEYMDYCRQNVTPNAFKSNTTAEINSIGELEIANTGRAFEAYKMHESDVLNSTFEEAV